MWILATLVLIVLIIPDILQLIWGIVAMLLAAISSIVFVIIDMIFSFFKTEES